MSKLQELKDWLAQLPAEAEIVSVVTSIFEDDAQIIVRIPPDGEYLTKEILGIERNIRGGGQ